MGLICVETTVADYATWRPNFDSHADRRTAAGISNPRVFRDADNGNHIIIIGDAADPARARQALESPEYRKRMQESGQVTTPKIYVIE